MASRPTINSLPMEVLAHILSFLDSPSPLEQHDLYNEPVNLCQKKLNTAFLAKRKDGPMSDAFYRKHPAKAVSLVCRSWRQAVLPALFRRVIWATGLIKRPEEDEDPVSVLPFLDFLLRNNLASTAQSITILLYYPATRGLFHRHGGRLAITPPPEVWVDEEYHGPEYYPGIQETDRYDEYAIPKAHQLWDNNWLWETICQHLDPLRFTLISSPALLLMLLSRSIALEQSKFIMPAYNIISLSRASGILTLPNPSQPENVDGSTLMPCTLFTLCPWDSLLLNEGSGLDIQRTSYPDEYDYTSLIQPLLNRTDPYLSPFLKKMHKLSYIAVHPHTSSVADKLMRWLPPVKSLHLQLSPQGGPEADEYHLRPSRLREREVSDWPVLGLPDLPKLLQTGRNLLCAEILRSSIGNRGSAAWRGLKVLSIPDVANEDGWKVAGPMYQTLQEKNRCRMKYMGDGLFVTQREG